MINNQLFDLVFKCQGHNNQVLIRDTLQIPNTRTYKALGLVILFYGYVK